CCAYPPLEVEGRLTLSEAKYETGWGDGLSASNTARVERSPHPARAARDRPSPSRAGLSHVADELEKEGIFPASALDLLAHGDAGGVSANEVDRVPPQGRKVFGTVVFSGSAGVLAEDDVEHPVQLVLDAPVTAYDLQKSFCRYVLGQHVIPNGWLAGGFAMQPSARGDAGDGRHSGKAVCHPQAAVAHDGGASGFGSIVGARLETLRHVALARAGEAAFDVRKQFALIFLESQHVVGAAGEHLVGEGAIA